MRAFVRRTLIGTAVVVGLLFCLIFAAGLFFNVNRHRGDIEAAVKNATGLTLEIQDRIFLRLLPNLHVTIKDAKLLNGNHELLSTSKISIGVRLIPLLLHKQVQISEIKLRKPQILLAKDARGRWNFEVKKQKTQKHEEQGPSVVQNLSIDSFSITDGSITYLDAKAGQRVLINDLDARLSYVGSVVKLSSMKAHLFGGDFSQNGYLDLRNGRIDLRLYQSTNHIDLAQLAAGLGAHVSLAGKISSKIAVQASGKDWNSVARDITARLDLAGNEIAFTSGNVEAKAGTLEVLAEKTPRGPPFLAKTLKIDEGKFILHDSDQNEVVHASGIRTELNDLTANPRIKIHDVIDAFKMLSFQGHLTARRLRIVGRDGSDVYAHFRDQGGLIDADSVKFTAFNGSSFASGVADLRPVLPKFVAYQTLQNVDLGLLVPPLKDRVEGKVDGEFQLQWAGANSNALLHQSVGNLNIRGNNLTVKGIDIDSLAGKLKGADAMSVISLGTTVLSTAATSLSELPEGDQTKVSHLRILVSDWNVDHGIAKIQDVGFSTNANTIALLGKINLNKNEFENFSVATVDRQGCATHKVGIAGSLSDPKPTQTAVGAVAGAVIGTPESIFNSTIGRVVEGKKSCDKVYSGAAIQAGIS